MSRLLAWSFGASVGLVVGFLVGESFRDGLALARLGRPEPREGAGTGRSATGPVNGAQIGAQPIPAQREGTLDVGDLHDRPDYQEALARAEGMPWEPGVELSDWERSIAKPAAARRYFYPLAEVAAEFGIDLADDEPCTHTLGSLTCPFRGPHDNHTYQGMYAPDAKDDADERIE